MCGQDILCLDCGEESAPGILLEATDEDVLSSNRQSEVAEQSSKK
jgi:DNA-directed RNA polymerase II subunit RPB9